MKYGIDELGNTCIEAKERGNNLLEAEIGRHKGMDATLSCDKAVYSIMLYGSNKCCVHNSFKRTLGDMLDLCTKTQSLAGFDFLNTSPVKLAAFSIPPSVKFQYYTPKETLASSHSYTVVYAGHLFSSVTASS